MSVVNAAPTPLYAHPATPVLGSPSGSSALAVTACFMAAPTSFSVMSRQAAGLGNEPGGSVTGAGVGTGGTTVGGGSTGGTIGAVGGGYDSSPGVPHTAFRTIIELANESTPSCNPAS